MEVSVTREISAHITPVADGMEKTQTTNHMYTASRPYKQPVISLLT